MRTRFAGILAALIYVALSHPASAQLSNKPFQFRNSIDGIGMSVGGRQAIMNEKLYGMAPGNLARGVNGMLLSVEKGRGGSPIIRYDDMNDILVSYKGTNFSGENRGMKTGVFNSFFMQQAGGGSNAARYAAMPPYAAINTWTRRVSADGMAVVYMDSGYDTIDAWTGQALVLND